MLEAKPQLDEAAARALVVEALDRLFVEEYDLLEEGSERAVSAQYARHLAHALRQRSDLLVGRWSVDCEYHRLGLDPKTLPRLEQMLADVAPACGWPATGLTGRVIPDVIVHRRGSGRRDGNLIVCELKRVGCSAEARRRRNPRSRDQNSSSGVA
jgi:hypothetical protein